MDDGAGDAQVGALRCRSKRYARMGLAETALALVWRDNCLCIAHETCHVVIDATTGAEIWRVHLRTPPACLSDTAFSGLDPPTPASPSAAPSSPPRSSTGRARSASGGGVGSSSSSSIGSPGRSLRAKRNAGRSDEEIREALLASGRFVDDAPGSIVQSTSGGYVATAAGGSEAVLQGPDAAVVPARDVVLVEQMVWLGTANATAVAPERSSSSSSSNNGLGRELPAAAGGGGGGADRGRWVGEQRGRCWLDVARGIWYRDREEATPASGGRVWASGWRIAFDSRRTTRAGSMLRAGIARMDNAPQKDSCVRRRKWTRQTRSADPAAAGELMPSSSRLGCGTLLGLAGGQQLLHGEMGGSGVSLLFDLTQLTLRPALVWNDQPPDAVAAVPPLLLAYFAGTRTLSTYHLATGELVRSVVVERPLEQPDENPIETVSAAAWLDALGEDEAAFSPRGGVPPARRRPLAAAPPSGGSDTSSVAAGAGAAQPSSGPAAAHASTRPHRRRRPRRRTTSRTACDRSSTYRRACASS